MQLQASRDNFEKLANFCEAQRVADGEMPGAGGFPASRGVLARPWTPSSQIATQR
jgi:hypothetical protein